MMNIRIILFCSFLGATVGAPDFQAPDNKVKPCGLYGFRCLDMQHAQICDEKYYDKEGSVSVTPRPRFFICANGLVCDEEKKEFCSPEKSQQNCTCTKRKNCACESCRRKEFLKNPHTIEHLRFRKKARNFSKTTAIATASPLSTFGDDVEATTQSDEVDPWNGSPPIDCMTHGFYPGMFEPSEKALNFIKN